MATRLYLSSTQTPAAGTTPQNMASNWTTATSADIRMMSFTKDGSAMTSKTSGAAGSTNATVLNRLYKSPALTAVTFPAGSTFTINLRGLLSNATNATANMRVILYRLNAGATSTSFATLNMGSGSTSNYTTTLTNRTLTITLASQVTFSDGDFLVMEVGAQFGGTNTSRTVSQSFGGDNASDLPSDNTTTTALNPYIESSVNLTQYVPPFLNRYSSQLLCF